MIRNFKLSNRSRTRMIGVDQRLHEITQLAIKISLVDFGIPRDGGMRHEQRQNELFLQGVSKCDGIIAKSKHQTGLALDFYAYVDGKASWEPAHLAMVATAFLQAASQLGYSLSWGGLWGGSDPMYGWDMGHVELV